MKEVIYGNELKEIMKKAINLLCDAVGSTLGPSGNNVIINSDLAPYITNDGATIARTISSSDKRINTILELAKEASLKTNEEVGDGTTTTLVLLQSIFNEGIKEIEKGRNPIILKSELNKILELIIEKIDKIKEIPNKENLFSIAKTSSNNTEIANITTEVYLKMNNKYSIKLDESMDNKTYYKIKKGYILEEIEISPLYFSNKEKIELNNSSILLLNGYLSNLELISGVINEGLERNKNIVIFADDYSEEVKNDILLYYLNLNRNIFIFKIPNYGARKIDIEDDIKELSNCNIKNIDYENIYYSDLGEVDNIEIKKDSIKIVINKNVDNYINCLKNKLYKTKDDYEKELLEERISKLENGIATIYVGGNTRTEIKEKMMRYEDALCALEVASKGIVPGEGIALLKISEELSNGILKESLQKPFIKILENSGYNYEPIKEEIIKSSYKKIFNLGNGKLENINNNIVDPKEVVIKSLKNAVSIATLLLTTNYLVINEEKEAIPEITSIM